MSDRTLHVEVVAADRLVWSGEATAVNGRTASGEIGILADHSPVLSLLDSGAVEVQTVDGETVTAAVDDGFISVANNRVSILASHAELAEDIDLSAARSELDSARGDDGRSPTEMRRLEARVKVAEKVS